MICVREENEISTAAKHRTIADTFPLLRAIVVVQTPPSSVFQDFHKCAVRTDEIKKILETKFPNQRRAVGEVPELMQQIARMTGFGFGVQPIATGDILKFSLGDYKYDQRVLSGLKDKLMQKYNPVVTPVKDNEAMQVKAAEVAEQTVDGAVNGAIGATIIAGPEAAHVGAVAGAILSVLEGYLTNAAANGKRDNRLKLIMSAYAAEYGDEALKSELDTFTPEGNSTSHPSFIVYIIQHRQAYYKVLTTKKLPIRPMVSINL